MFCRKCGAEIPNHSAFCQRCGFPTNRAPKKKQDGVILALELSFAIIFFAIFSLAFVEQDGKPERVSQGHAATISAKPETYTVGDTIKFQEYQITFVGVTESNGSGFTTPSDGKVFVLCEFEIKNISDEDVTITSLGMFDAYIDDYLTSFELSATLSSEKGDISGTIAPGKKTAGVVGYATGKGWKEIEIHFEPHLFSNSEIVFTYKREI